MDTRMTALSASGAQPDTANRRLKARWSIWMVRSIFAAAAVHASVLIVWPAWEVHEHGPIDQPVELIQLTPIATSGGITEVSEGRVAALPSLDEVQLALDETREESNQEIDDLAEAYGTELRADAYPLVPEIVEPNTVGMLEETRMILERLSMVEPDITSVGSTTAWPEIRNPTIIRRYLRSRYNPIHRDPGATGMVSVALWIDERGTVSRARVRESSGFPALDEIAVILFQSVANFAPARSGSSPVPVKVTVSVPFMVPW